MSTAASRATELTKLYQNWHKIDAAAPWEEVLLDNANRVSAPLVMKMLAQMGLNKDTTTPFKMFENACGAGVVASSLQTTIQPQVLQKSSILCGDFSQQSMDLVKKRIEAEGWVNTTAEIIDGQKTGLPDGEFTHVATNIGFHVIPDSETALNEAIRILKPGGVLGFTTWHRFPGFVEDISEAFKSFPFEAPFSYALQTTSWGNWENINWVRKTLEGKGLEDVKVDVLAHITRVDSTDHFLSHFGMMVDWVMNSGWSEELRKAHPKDEVFRLLRESLDQKYQNGPWELSWVSLIASGRIPL
ncbi:S-adenosyl-L-methionine-dependent methyltransferase [Podospora australis]|uniref:S-adenosyl-L-methionine-dependent methyltransferase n=1 Tax=Podospora australis TaxID=1536484 RepID=A0AAN6WU65_9PEZI|nr:S-adenosyl-L-methionine-dependent methyltransferase [Podospora australis]